MVEIDGQAIAIQVSADAITRLIDGASVTVAPCDPAEIDLGAGAHALTTATGGATGIAVDQVVLRSGAEPAETAAPTVTMQRSRTTRTATVTDCPDGCWLILGEGYNDGWHAESAGKSLGAPRQVSGGFNGWRLPGSTSPVTVTMTWTPQRTMWFGMGLAALAVLACALLIWRDKTADDMRAPGAPTPNWPAEIIGRRRALVTATALVVLAGLVISPTYGVLAGVVGLAVVWFKRPLVAGAASLALVGGLAVLIVRRQLRYRLVANPSWPAAFDDLHRLGLLVVVLLLASTIADDCPADQAEQVT